ncbi:hypothetical protein EJ02DRAFT_422013 [Clathrospora elynae]|uniref:Uncharacterized protein n=1 Tax=Clathrospora elynae TaxID=706981 RepID=A0A6A5SSH9_9PLEO|nr:hypothetical protein EJ02DRAFT_422013 [Clathrospora elynae]
MDDTAPTTSKGGALEVCVSRTSCNVISAYTWDECAESSAKQNRHELIWPKWSRSYSASFISNECSDTTSAIRGRKSSASSTVDNTRVSSTSTSSTWGSRKTTKRSSSTKNSATLPLVVDDDLAKLDMEVRRACNDYAKTLLAAATHDVNISQKPLEQMDELMTSMNEVLALRGSLKQPQMPTMSDIVQEAVVSVDAADCPLEPGPKSKHRPSRAYVPVSETDAFVKHLARNHRWATTVPTAFESNGTPAKLLGTETALKLRYKAQGSELGNGVTAESSNPGKMVMISPDIIKELNKQNQIRHFSGATRIDSKKTSSRASKADQQMKGA